MAYSFKGWGALGDGLMAPSIWRDANLWERLKTRDWKTRDHHTGGWKTRDQ